KVDYEVLGAQVRVTESKYPTIRVETLGSWSLPNGQVQSNLNFYVDGFVIPQLAWQYPSQMNRLILNDGKPDFVFEIVDRGQDGLLDYQLMRYVGLSPAGYGIDRIQLYVNEGANITSLP